MAMLSAMVANIFVPWINFVFMIFYLVTSGNANFCSTADYLGSTSLTQLGSSQDYNTGRQYLMTDNEYVTTCCGYVTDWGIHAGNTGTIIFQVWRPTGGGGSYSLVGDNTANVSSTGTFTYLVNFADQINIQTNDVIGWYIPGTDIVMYKSGGSRNDNNYVETISQPGAGDTIAFSNVEGDRDYAIYASLGNESPVFSNLDASITVSKSSISTSTSVYTALASDSNPNDSITYTIQSISPSTDFTVNSGTGQVTSLTSSLSAMIYTIVIRATDTCGSTIDGTLTIAVVNYSPVIHSLPDVVQLSESAVDEALLHTVNVTDPDGDSITCSLSVSPSGPFITKCISSGGSLAAGIYVQSNPNFDYTSVNSYELTITCNDSSLSDSEILYVYITQNQVPVIENLRNVTSIYSNLTISSVVFSVLATDSEGDQMYFNLSCFTAVTLCPFSMYSNGAIILTTSLLSSSTSVYELDITVSDDYSSSGIHRLTVYVTDLNLTPSLTNLPASIQVTEDEDIRTVIFDSEVYDGNGDTIFTFTASFSPSSSAALFNVNASNGIVTIADTLNFLTQTNNYTISIQVSDGLATSNSGDLQIEIIDVNQAPVLYQDSYKVEAQEGPAGTEFPDPGYNVYDPDSDTLTYAFDAGSNSAGFNINSTTGIVSYSIEYDVDDASTNVTTFVWLITISDPNGLSTTATLTVSILDINDNVPSFSSNSYTASVFGSATPGTIILTVSSTDRDLSSQYREVEFSMHDTNEFRIDHNGNIFVYDSLISYQGTTDNCYIRVKNPDISSYDTAYVNIYIVPRDSDSYFDNPANVAWVTLTCILVPIILAAVAFLIYHFCIKPRIAMKPPMQVAPYETRKPIPRPVSQDSRPPRSKPVTPSDIRVIKHEWQAWNTGAPAWQP